MRALFLALVLALGAAAQEGEWGQRGISREFATAGSFVYAADGRGVSVYDVSLPAQIRRIDSESGDETYDVALSGSGELFAATAFGIDRFQVAADGTLTRRESTVLPDPVSKIAAAPRRVGVAGGTKLFVLEEGPQGYLLTGSINYRNPILSLVFVEGLLYVGVERGAIHVVDPATLQEISAVSSGPEGLALAGTTLWAGSVRQGLVAIDVRDPRQPVVIGQVGASEYRLHGVAAAGSLVFGFEPPNVIRVFDAAIPKNPRLVGTRNEWVSAVATVGSRLVLSGPEIDSENLRYESGLPLRLFDADASGGLALAGEFRDLAGPVSGVWTNGSVAWVVDPPMLRVIDISKTAAPREITSLRLPSGQERIRVKHGVAVVYGRDVVHFLDARDLLAPKYLGTWDNQGHPISNASILKPNRVLEANQHSGLHVVDTTNPANAIQVGWRLFHYHDVVTGDDVVYGLLHGEFLIAEVVGDRTVVDRDVRSFQGEQLEIAPPNAAMPHWLLSRGLDGVRIFDVATDRFNPVQTRFLPTRTAALIGTGEEDAYVASRGELLRIDLKGGGAMEPTGMKVRSPLQIMAAGRKIVVADRYSLKIFGPDTASPLPPEEPGRRRAVRH